MSDYEVGYGKPPSSIHIKPGERRNSNGRRGKRPKPVIDNSEAAILERLDAEIVAVGSMKMTKREAGLRRLHNQSLMVRSERCKYWIRRGSLPPWPIPSREVVCCAYRHPLILTNGAAEPSSSRQSLEVMILTAWHGCMRLPG